MYKDMTTEELIERLEKAGDSAPAELIQAIAERREIALPILLEKFFNRSYWEAEDKTRWLPIHILHIFSILKDADLIQYLIKAIVIAHLTERDDIIYLLPIVIREIGVSAIEPLKRFINESSFPYSRSTAVDGLLAISFKYTEYKDEILTYLRSLLREDEDSKFLSILADKFADIGDDLSLPKIRDLWEKDLLDPLAFSLDMDDEEELKEKWGKNYIEDYLKSSFLKLYKKVKENSKDLSFREEKEEVEDLEKKLSQELNRLEISLKLGDKVNIPKKLPGRNDPCFCGSGEKFKKCCLSLVENLPATEVYSMGYFTDTRTLYTLPPNSVLLALDNIFSLAIDLIEYNKTKLAMNALKKIEPIVKEKGLYFKYLKNIIPLICSKNLEELEKGGLQLISEIEKYANDLQEEEKIEADILVAEILSKIGKEEESRKKLEELISRYPDSPTLNFEYAKLIENTDVNEAVKYYIKSLEKAVQEESDIIEEILVRLIFLLTVYDIKLEEKQSNFINSYLKEIDLV